MGIGSALFGVLGLGAALARSVGVRLDPRYTYAYDLWAACEYGLAAAVLLLCADRIVRFVYRR
jgi:hypothetical protein